MKYGVAELEGALLDEAVARSEGYEDIETFIRRGESGLEKHCAVVMLGADEDNWWTDYQPSRDWAQGGPIIHGWRISLTCQLVGGSDIWIARFADFCAQAGPTPLIAAMRCYVTSKFGEEVEL